MLRDKRLSNPKIQKGRTMVLAVLLVAVFPTMLLTHSNMQLALAQSANQTSSAAPPPPPPQALQDTFYAKGVNGILVLDPTAIQDLPPPSKYFGTIVGGNWSLDVVNRSIQNFTMNLLSINPSGAIVEAGLIDGAANTTTTTTTRAENATNTVTASNTTNNMTFGRSDNDIVLRS